MHHEVAAFAVQFYENASFTLLIAGCFRFFTLIQLGDRPAR